MTTQDQGFLIKRLHRLEDQLNKVIVSDSTLDIQYFLHLSETELGEVNRVAKLIFLDGSVSECGISF